jgi:hypothetical protein
VVYLVLGRRLLGHITIGFEALSTYEDRVLLERVTQTAIFEQS